MRTAYAEVSGDRQSLQDHLTLGIGYAFGAGLYGVASALIVAHERLLPGVPLAGHVQHLLGRADP